MTLLQRSDDAGSGVSYLELAELIMKSGSQANHDLEQLWRRIVFFICISNTDDHLRNHGFLLGPSGWSLAPYLRVSNARAKNIINEIVNVVSHWQDVAKAYGLRRDEQKRIASAFDHACISGSLVSL